MLSIRRLAVLVVATVALSACAIGPGWHGGPHMGAYQGGSTADWSARMDAHMKAMQAVHDAMAKAQTPEERQAIMESHRALMHDGGGMMGTMPCGPGPR